ncbi:Protein AMN1 [Orchesella cincta]|uniref:Protein AMN1 n=1 Tax=Orchesella cincta TaxID=48709 RepID=A0A1D2M984_ORCCI|nr:Protein AMN1 [Orchesella cincta]
MRSVSHDNYDLMRRRHQFQLESSVELGTLQQLAVSVIVTAYKDHREEWIKSMPCIPKKIRQEICKRLMYKGDLDNELFSLCVDVDRNVWDLRTIRGNFTSESCAVLSQCKSLELLRLSYPSCSSAALTNMLKNFTQLRLLEVTNTEEMNDSVIEAVASSCPHLEVLNVKGTAVTNQGMLTIANLQLKLSELDISRTNISREGVDFLKSGPMKETLKLLRFNRCEMLGSAKTIRDIVLSFSNLKDYSFDFIEGEDEAEINDALNQLPGPTPGQNVFFNIPL